MNFQYRLIFKIIGLILLITGGMMFFPLLCAVYYNNFRTIQAMGLTAAVQVVLGAALFFGLNPSKTNLKTRDSYLLVLLTWVFCSFFGSWPFYLTGQVPTAGDAIFEAISGYTTTGATVAIDIYSDPALLLWKASMHWLGGMGILVFMVALLPSLGIGSKNVADPEAPGPNISQIAPRARDVAKLLYLVYISLSVIEYLLLWIGSPMTAFEALVHTMGSISTAGLYMHPGGIGYYNSLYVEIIISIFTVLSAVNYAFYAAIIKRDINNIRQNAEIKTFAVLYIIITALVTFDLYIHEVYATVGDSLRHAFFQVSAFMSTAGFVLDNYIHWPSLTKFFFIVMLIVGGCASSTAGGMKLIRFLTALKSIRRNIRQRVHPNAVTTTKIGGRRISEDVIGSITTFIILYFVTFLLGSLVVSLDNQGLETTFSAVLSCMSTTGIFLGNTGATGDFAIFSGPIRLFLSFIMVVGRLELFTVFLAFFPSFWNLGRSR